MVSLPPFLKQLLALCALLPGIFLSLLALHALHEAYLANCPEKDILSWDANLRTITVLDQIRDLKTGEFTRFVGPYFQAPTWPMLRSTGSLFLFLSADRPVSHDIYLTVFTFALLLLALALAFSFFRLPALQAGAAFFCMVVLLFHSREIPAYIFSSMLEIQGMLFTFLCAIVTIRLVSRQKENFSWIFFGISFLAFQGLVHTKYPYGLLFFPALFFALAAVERDSWLIFTRSVFENADRFRYVFVTLIGIWVAAFWILPGLKTRANLLSLATVFFIIYFYFILRKSAVKEKTPIPFLYAYYAGALPFAVWMAIHPDRITALLDSQVHTQSQAEFFAIRLISDVFDNPLLPLASFGTGGVALLLPHRERKPVLAAMITVLFPFLILELATDNKQLRHIYHLIPALAFLCLLSLYRSSTQWLRIVQAGLLLLSAGQLFWPGGLLTGDYIEKRIYCFTGIKPGLYDPVREVVSALPMEKNVVLLNAFAHPAAPLPGRAMTTELELLSRVRARDNGLKLFSSKENRSCEESDHPIVVYVRETCQKSPYDEFAFTWLEEHCREWKAGQNRKINEHFCITEFAAK